jgi:hypothetical protein
VYYVKVVTRGVKSASTGTPRQALDYVTDGHDTRRDPGYSDAELAYIARMGDGWKTDLEGGRVPLVGLGELQGKTDEQQMAKEFEQSCVPHNNCATTGYKSLTFTLPKEVSLFAESHREEAKAAMYAAVQKAWMRSTETSDIRPSPPFTRGTRTGKFTITPTFWLENSRKTGRPPSFGASRAAVAETRGIGSSPN